MTKTNTKKKISARAKAADEAKKAAYFRHFDALLVRHPSSAPCQDLAHLVVSELFCDDHDHTELEIRLAHQINMAITGWLTKEAGEFNDDDDDELVDDPCHVCGVAIGNQHADYCPYWWMGRQIVAPGGFRATVEAFHKASGMFRVSRHDNGDEAFVTMTQLRDADLTVSKPVELAIVNAERKS